jgi:hypothetical protein
MLYIQNPPYYKININNGFHNYLPKYYDSKRPPVFFLLGEGIILIRRIKIVKMGMKDLGKFKFRRRRS